jgi:hypothetical protein
MGVTNTSHPSPELCGNARKGVVEALTGEDAGEPLSRETSTNSGLPTPLTWPEGITGVSEKGELAAESARSKTLSTYRSFIYGN